MKTNKPHNFLLLALTAVFSCCSGEDYSDITVSGTPSGETSTAPLTITVTDGGYASLSGGSSTRASEVDYQTVFTEGDQIGVFAVKDDAIVKEVSNLCLTATPSTDANAALTWKSDSDETPASINGATYYAYYPYKSDLKIEDLAPTANTAAGFFASVITNWTPAKHQSTYADYTAQDLMIAQGTPDVSNKSLSFSMSHQMALVVIDLPKIMYTFTNTDPSIPEYIIDAPDTKFNNFIPYRMDNGMYRYLVHPSKDDALLSGSYTGENGTTAWKVNTKSIPAGNYKIYKVDKGSSAMIEKAHKLAVGDFYMKDGSLLAGSTTLTLEQQAACIGIVFWVGSDDAFDKDPFLKKNHPNCSHGLVVALNDAGNMRWSDATEYVQTWINNNNTYKDVVILMDESIMRGYSNTLAMVAYNEAKGVGSRYRVLPCDAIQQYSTKYPVPTTSSGWYFPSLKEIKYVCWGQGKGQGTAGRNYLNGQISKVSGGTQFIISTPYWSSTERRDKEDHAFGLKFSDGKLYYGYPKNENRPVRLLLAF